MTMGQILTNFTFNKFQKTITYERSKNKNRQGSFNTASTISNAVRNSIGLVLYEVQISGNFFDIHLCNT